MRMLFLLSCLIVPLVHGCAGANANSTASQRGTPRFAADCLREGELCNPLNDRCCAGYYCFGGLAPTCFRKP